MMKTESPKGCLQRDSVERNEYVGASSIGPQEKEERSSAMTLFELILNRNNLNRAYKRVKKNKGAPGIDGMTGRQCTFPD